MSTELKPSIEAEFLAEFKAPPEAVAPVVEAQAPAPSEDPAPPKVEAEKPKDEPKPAEVAAPSLARRLATLAAAEKRSKDAEAARAAKDAELAPLAEKLAKIKGAKSRAEAARLALDLDDEAEADLFLELHQKFEGDGKPKPKDPAADIEKLISKALDARDAEKKAGDEKALETMRENYTADTLAVLETRGDEWPLVAIAPPNLVDITAISEAWLTANGEIPEPEAVLKLIQDERQTKLDERRAAAEKKTSAKPAPAKPGETSGPKAKPIATNDVAVVPPRKLSIAEEYLATRASSGA